MSKIAAIAWNTFREAVRNRILYIILVFALLLLIFSGVLRNFTIADHERVIKDFGMGAINFFGLIIAIFIGITLIYNELEKKTIYTIVSKPIDRYQFLLGKYFGLLLTIYVNVLIMTYFFFVALHWQQLTTFDEIRQFIWVFGEGEPHFRLAFVPQGLQVPVYYVWAAVKAIFMGLGTFFGVYQPDPDYTQYLMLTTWMTCLELAVVTAFAILFSTFSSPTLSAFFTILVFIIGRLNEDIYRFALMMEHKAGSWEALSTSQKMWGSLAKGAFHIAPNLELFNKRVAVIYPREFDWIAPTFYSICYGVVYAAMVLALAILVFRRRNFK